MDLTLASMGMGIAFAMLGFVIGWRSAMTMWLSAGHDRTGLIYKNDVYFVDRRTSQMPVQVAKSGVLPG